jgi:indole-3-glycerol phosphate synthase
MWILKEVCVWLKGYLSLNLKLRKAGSAALMIFYFLKQHGFQGFLIGENFMKATNPTIAFAEFVKQLKAKAHED